MDIVGFDWVFSLSHLFIVCMVGEIIFVCKFFVVFVVLVLVLTVFTCLQVVYVCAYKFLSLFYCVYICLEVVFVC